MARQKHGRASVGLLRPTTVALVGVIIGWMGTALGQAGERSVQSPRHPRPLARGRDHRRLLDPRSSRGADG
jgi:hypothetical protein